MKRQYVIYLVLVLILLLVILDQWSKWYIKTHYHLYESFYVVGEWFQFYFVENEGMAFGMKWGGDIGKVVLSIVRLFALIIGFFIIKRCLVQQYITGFICAIAVIYAGAIGNTIDSLFYGIIYDESMSTQIATLFPEDGGYATFLFGKVVDMLYFPVIRTTWPEWVPLLGGERFEFFSPIFNIADSCVSVGTATILLFYRKQFAKSMHLPKTKITTWDS